MRISHVYKNICGADVISAIAICQHEITDIELCWYVLMSVDCSWLRMHRKYFLGFIALLSQRSLATGACSTNRDNTVIPLQGLPASQ